MHMPLREREEWQSPPEIDEYTLTAKGVLLGRVEIRAGTRPGPAFKGYFHPARAFARVVGLFDECNRTGDRWARLYHSGLTTAAVARRGWQLDVDRAVERAEAASDLARDALDALGLELTDASGRRVKTMLINVERVKLEEECAWYDEPSILEGPSPFEELDAGVDVTPYRLSADSRDKERPAGRPARTRHRAVPWNPEEDRQVDLELDAWEAARAGETEDEEDLDELEWEGGSPSLEDRVILWRRAAKGHPRDTLFSNLDLARPREPVNLEGDRDLWVKSVQLARAAGLLSADLSEYLIWSIVTDVEDYKFVKDPNDELMDQRVALAEKLGLEVWDSYEMTDPPAEVVALDEAIAERHDRRMTEVLLSAGETSLAAAMREQPQEFAARMAAWEERVSKEHEEKERPWRPSR